MNLDPSSPHRTDFVVAPAPCKSPRLPLLFVLSAPRARLGCLFAPMKYPRPAEGASDVEPLPREPSCFCCSSSSLNSHDQFTVRTLYPAGFSPPPFPPLRRRGVLSSSPEWMAFHYTKCHTRSGWDGYLCPCLHKNCRNPTFFREIQANVPSPSVC